jgi:hypothetical protein
MADIEVIYDPVKELAAIVNLDDRCGWGPAFVGPNAGAVLQLWVDSMPFDVTILDVFQAGRAFLGWLNNMAAAPPEPAPTPPVSPVESPDRPFLDGAPLAEAVASASGAEPPEPQPADTDMEADPSAPATVITCPLCAGAKTVTNDETGEIGTCGMCGATGVVRMQVPS